MSTSDMDTMANEVEGKVDINTPNPPIHRFSQYTEPEEEKSESCCRCYCPLWCLVTLILFALILGIAGVAAYNLYANITNSQKLNVVEEVANQDTIIQLFNITNNDTIEIALEQFVEGINGDLQRIETDIRRLRNITSDNINLVKEDIRVFETNINSRLSQIENSTLNRMELDRVETDLASLENRVDAIEADLSSAGPSLTSGHPFLLTGIGLLALLSVCY